MQQDIGRLIECGADHGITAAADVALVTGQQVVGLNFFPGTPIDRQKTDLPYFQIPSVPSATQQLISSAESAAQDLPTLVRKATAVLDRVLEVLSPENEAAIHSALESAAATMKTLQTDS